MFFSEDEPDLNNELEISVKHSITLPTGKMFSDLFPEFQTADRRNGGGYCKSTDGKTTGCATSCFSEYLISFNPKSL